MGRFLPPFWGFWTPNPKLGLQKEAFFRILEGKEISPKTPYPRGRSFSPKITERAKPATKKSDLQILEGNDFKVKKHPHFPPKKASPVGVPETKSPTPLREKPFCPKNELKSSFSLWWNGMHFYAKHARPHKNKLRMGT